MNIDIDATEKCNSDANANNTNNNMNNIPNNSDANPINRNNNHDSDTRTQNMNHIDNLHNTNANNEINSTNKNTSLSITIPFPISSIIIPPNKPTYQTSIDNFSSHIPTLIDTISNDVTKIITTISTTIINDPRNLTNSNYFMKQIIANNENSSNASLVKDASPSPSSSNEILFPTASMDVKDAILKDPIYTELKTFQHKDNFNPFSDAALTELSFVEYDLPPPPVKIQERMEHFKQVNTDNWNRFYVQNGNRCYKNRHWILQEFPELRDYISNSNWKPPTREELVTKAKSYLLSTTKHGSLNECITEWLVTTHTDHPTFYEIGCGVGNAILPLLAEIPKLRVVASDVSNAALHILKQNERLDLRDTYHLLQAPSGKHLLHKFASSFFRNDATNRNLQKGLKRNLAEMKHATNLEVEEANMQRPKRIRSIKTIYFPDSIIDESTAFADSEQNSSSINAEDMIEIIDSPPLEGFIDSDTDPIINEAATRGELPSNPSSILEDPVINKDDVEHSESKPSTQGSMVIFQHNLEKATFPKALNQSIDFATLIFVLSTTSPCDHLNILRAVKSILRPGGILFIRDYARYDMIQMRFGMQDQIGPNLYVRGDDGTRAYFFSLEELKREVIQAGFEIIQAVICLKKVQNRKLFLEMNRRFVQIRARVPY